MEHISNIINAIVKDVHLTRTQEEFNAEHERLVKDVFDADPIPGTSANLVEAVLEQSRLAKHSLTRRQMVELGVMTLSLMRDTSKISLPDVHRLIYTLAIYASCVPE